MFFQEISVLVKEILFLESNALFNPLRRIT